MNVALPGMKAPTKRWMRATKLSVTEVILDADRMNDTRKTVAVLTRANPPQPKPKPGQPVVRRPVLSSRGRYNAKLKVGASYVLLLKKMPDRKEFYLVPMAPYVQTATKATVDRVRKIGNVDAWPWGKADGRGLQVAVFQSSAVGRGSGGSLYAYNGKVYISVMVALRNAGAKPISMDLNPEHKAIQIEAVDSKGAIVQGDPYKNMGNRTRPGPSHVQTLAPGQVKFIGPTGLAAYGGVRTQMSLPTGPHKVHAVFALPPNPDAKANWSGSIRSGATTIEVKQRPTRTQRPPVRRTGVPDRIPGPKIHIKVD